MFSSNKKTKAAPSRQPYFTHYAFQQAHSEKQPILFPLSQFKFLSIAKESFFEINLNNSNNPICIPPFCDIISIVADMTF